MTECRLYDLDGNATDGLRVYVEADLAGGLRRTHAPADDRFAAFDCRGQFIGEGQCPDWTARAVARHHRQKHGAMQ